MHTESKPRHSKDRTFDFAIEIVGLCHKLNATGGVSRTLGRQLLNCGTSIGANVEEAQAGQSSADFISKCSIALKEARETIYWLRLLKACDHSFDKQVETLLNEADQLSRIIGSIVVRIRNAKKR
jgi:four helix bundle protein